MDNIWTKTITLQGIHTRKLYWSRLSAMNLSQKIVKMSTSESIWHWTKTIALQGIHTRKLYWSRLSAMNLSQKIVKMSTSKSIWHWTNQVAAARASTRATGPVLGLQKQRPRRAETTKQGQLFPLSSKGGWQVAAPASRESCCTLIFSGGGFLNLGTPSSRRCCGHFLQRVTVFIFWTFFHGVGFCFQAEPDPGRPQA